MTGSAFVATYAAKPFTVWERAAVTLAKEGGLVPWPLIPITITSGEHTATVHVASDVLAVGTPEDYVRLPLTPKVAQEIANLKGMLLPTPKLVYETWRASPNKLPPTPMIPNRVADLAQYAAHSKKIDAQIAGRAGLVSGHKKDVVVSSFLRPGKVVIFGWYQPQLADVFDNGVPMGNPLRQPIQPHSNVHGEGYVDYSHGIRFVSPVATVDGRDVRIEDALRNPSLARLFSHEGALTTTRYDAPFPTPSEAARLADIGLRHILASRRAAA